MEEIKIDIPQFDMKSQRLIKDHGSYILLKEDRLEFFLKADVLYSAYEEENTALWHNESWFTKGFVFKDRISGINVQDWDSYPGFPCCRLYIEATGCEDVKFAFPTRKLAGEAYKAVYKWIFNSDTPDH